MLNYNPASVIANKTPFFYGWMIVFTSSLSMFVRNAAATLTIAVFVYPMSEDLGWSRTLIVGAAAASGVASMFISPLAGWILQKFGSKFLISISPVIPHLSNECLSKLNINNYIWPDIDHKFLVEENISIVVQFNGKKRGIINTKKDILGEDLVKEIIKSKTFDKFLKENTIKKHFYVKNRLINLLI